MDATGYGVILGSLGLGAVGAALLLPRLRRELSVDRLAIAATLVFAAATLALATLRSVPLLVASMMAGGMAWLSSSPVIQSIPMTAAALATFNWNPRPASRSFTAPDFSGE